MIKKVFTSLFLCFGLFFGISINDITVNAYETKYKRVTEVEH